MEVFFRLNAIFADKAHTKYYNSLIKNGPFRECKIAGRYRCGSVQGYFDVGRATRDQKIMYKITEALVAFSEREFNIGISSVEFEDIVRPTVLNNYADKPPWE